MPASPKLEALEREQLETRVVQLRDRRRHLERQLDELRGHLGPLLVRGNDLGITYEELAELSGISRARVAQVLAEKRGEAEADAGQEPERRPRKAAAR